MNRGMAWQLLETACSGEVMTGFTTVFKWVATYQGHSNALYQSLMKKNIQKLFQICRFLTEKYASKCR